MPISGMQCSPQNIKLWALLNLRAVIALKLYHYVKKTTMLFASEITYVLLKKSYNAYVLLILDKIIM